MLIMIDFDNIFKYISNRNHFLIKYLFFQNVISDMCVMLDPAKKNDTKEYFESNKNEVTQIINALVAWVEEVPVRSFAVENKCFCQKMMKIKKKHKNKFTKFI